MKKISMNYTEYKEDLSESLNLGKEEATYMILELLNDDEYLNSEIRGNDFESEDYTQLLKLIKKLKTNQKKR